MVNRLALQSGFNLLAAFCNLTVAFSFGLFSLPVFYPILARSHQWNHASVAAGGSVVLMTIGVLSPFIGWLVDRCAPVIVLLIGICFVSLSLVLLSTTRDLLEYFLFCAVLGVGTSAVSILPNSLLIASSFSSRRGLAVGVVNAGIGVGGFVAPILTSLLISAHGVSKTFLFLSMCMVIPFVLTLFVVPPDTQRSVERVKTARRNVPDSRSLVRMPMFWIFGGSLFLGAHSTIAVQQHLVLYLTAQGFSARRAALALSTALGASFLGKLASGAVADRRSARLAMLLTILCVALGIAGLETFLARSNTVYLCTLVFGLGYGGIFNAAPLIVFEYFGTHRVGTVLGILILFFSFGSASGGLLAGYIYDLTCGYSVPFRVDLGLACIALILLLAGERHTRPAPVATAV